MLWQPHCDLRVVRTEAYLRAIRGVYGKILLGLALKKNSRPVLFDTLAAMCVTCNLFWYFVLISVSPIMISAYTKSNV